MPLTNLIVLALIQGLTEFLPISSSGHLIIVPKLISWQDQGLIIDVAVHAGSLLAVIIYLWRELWSITAALIDFRNLHQNPDLQLAKLIIIGSIPVVMMGLIISLISDNLTRSIEIIGWATLAFGILLGISDKIGLAVSDLRHMGIGDAFLIGVSQALALIPGASRAGLTITMARFLGYDRKTAARFSLLLAIPAILGASTLKGIELVGANDLILGIDVLIAVSVSFLAALASILSFVLKKSFNSFTMSSVHSLATYGDWCLTAIVTNPVSSSLKILRFSLKIQI